MAPRNQPVFAENLVAREMAFVQRLIQIGHYISMIDTQLRERLAQATLRRTLSQRLANNTVQGELLLATNMNLLPIGAVQGAILHCFGNMPVFNLICSF